MLTSFDHSPKTPVIIGFPISDSSWALNFSYKGIATSDLEALIKDSFSIPQLIFKHSTRCSISRYVLADFTAHFTYSSNELVVHYLDLLNYRELSNEIAYRFDIVHQSPQILVIKNGKAVADASHEGISELRLSNYI